MKEIEEFYGSLRVRKEKATGCLGGEDGRSEPAATAGSPSASTKAITCASGWNGRRSRRGPRYSPTTIVGRDVHPAPILHEEFFLE
jgi:hypothetical protein